MLVALVPAARAVTVDDFAALTFTNATGTKLPYRLFLPANYDSQERFPLVLYLHSYLENGRDNERQITDEPGPLEFLSDENLTRHPCIMAAPQNATGYWTDGAKPQLLLDFLDALRAELRIDEDRIYVTGMSMGGSATWELMCRRPGQFAAGVPMSGGAATKPKLIPHVPVWCFHAGDDGAVSVNESQTTIITLRKEGGTPIYTEYASGGHQGIWTTAFQTPGLVDWVMAQRRGVRAEPWMRMLLPTSSTWSTTATNLAFAGEVSRPELAVTRVDWRNFRNNTWGRAEGSNAWSIASVPLASNSTNAIVFTASGTSWSPELRGKTTFNLTCQVRQMPEPLVLSVARTDTGLSLSWSGGNPPFVVRRKLALTDADWTDVLTSATNGATLSGDYACMFFQVVGQ